MKNKLPKMNPGLRFTIRKPDKLKVLRELKELLVIALGAGPFAIAVNRILVPHAVVGGGLAGFCEILYFASGGFLQIWWMQLLINIGLLIVAIRMLGWRFCWRTAYGVLALTVWMKCIPIPDVPQITDPFMAVILGGLFAGCGLGFVLMNNGSTGGTDIIAMILSKYAHLPMGRALLTSNIVIICSAYFLPEVHSVEKVLFGLCYTFMSSTAVDWVMNRSRQSVQFFIFSKYWEEIAHAIMTEVPRGVTILDGEGGYTKEVKKVITVLARKSEVTKIFRLVRQIDPDAFVSETQTQGVFGQGFESIKTQA
ncbi:MAG: YitT family protein [Paludibacteraceae bacterium]|nr:YitT family protein [Paludibacteraceae bacterium]